jgi:hypothetical protein
MNVNLIKGNRYIFYKDKPTISGRIIKTSFRANFVAIEYGTLIVEDYQDKQNPLNYYNARWHVPKKWIVKVKPVIRASYVLEKLTRDVLWYIEQEEVKPSSLLLAEHDSDSHYLS